VNHRLSARAGRARRRAWLVGLGVAGAGLVGLGSPLGATAANAGVSLAPPGHPTLNGARARNGAASIFTPSQISGGASRSWPSVAPGFQPQLTSSPSATSGGSISNTSTNVGSAYTALPPTRIVDTRAGSGYADAGQSLSPGSTLTITVAGVGGAPSGAAAVALNVTVTDASAASFLSIYPTGGTQPLVSSLNWTAGQTVPNLVIVPVGTGNQVNLYNDAGTADVIVDLEGYFTPESAGSTVGSYVALTPARITDTRPNSGEANQGQTLGPGASLPILVSGQGGVPASTSDLEGVLLNVTVTDTTQASYLTVYPQGGSLPDVSNLNWDPGQTVANRVVVPINTTTGEITVFNDAGNADVIVDVDGYFTNGVAPAGASLYTAISPARLIDTRSGSGYFGAGQTLGPNSLITEPVASIGSLGSNVSAVLTNVTATDTSSASYLTVYPGPTIPLASDLNWAAGHTVANLTDATVNSSGDVSFYNDAGTADLVVDVFGYFSTTATLNGTTPNGTYLVSPNWSGYEEDNGSGAANDTAVSGTFTIPYLYQADPVNSWMSEWVGIDGFLNNNQNLIQAGIAEYQSSPGVFKYFPWWEILPAPATNVDASFPKMIPGDTVTVTIQQVSGTSWDITIDDVTQSENVTFPETYNPSTGTTETSAEWIVEAPTVSGSTTQLADYTPTGFTNLSVVGSDSEQSEIAMYQNPTFVSVPSGTGEGGSSFNIAYGDVIPPPP